MSQRAWRCSPTTGSSGSVGHIIGAYGYGTDPTELGKCTLTLRRTATGRWLIASDMDNGDRPPK